MNSPLPTAKLWHRYAAMIYEALLLIAVLFIADYLFISLTHNAQSPLLKALLQIYLLTVMAVYFSWFWMRGQSLAMKTWRIRLVSVNGNKLNLRQALLRYLFSWLIGFTQLWAFLDRDGQFLHDRLAGTRLVTDVRPA